MSTDTKTALLDSAEAAARRLGFDGFSYADLAEDVGIRKASIHYHFPSKADLSAAMMERYRVQFEQACADIDAAHHTAAARLQALVTRYSDALSGGTCLCLCVAFSISRDGLPEETTAQMSLFRRMMLDWIAGVFAAGKMDGSIKGVGDPAMEAAAALSLLEGAQLSARAAKNVDLFHAATRILVDRTTG